MTTPAHAIFNLLVLPREDRAGRSLLAAVALGAVVPDATMFVFYAYQKLIRGVPEGTIWNDLYFRPEWQGVFDAFHSWPLIGIAAWVAYRMGSSGWSVFFGSMAVHSVADFLLHNDDAHRHFFPLSDFRFVSPVSYWDPQHFGQLLGPLEALMVIVGSVVLSRRYSSRVVRALLGALAGLYVVGIGYALLVWASP
jgi:hypothetical protein